VELGSPDEIVSEARDNEREAETSPFTGLGFEHDAGGAFAHRRAIKA
jgi:hypothetical protein